MQGSDQRWKREFQVEGTDRRNSLSRWVGERSEVEGSNLMLRQWRKAI